MGSMIQNEIAEIKDASIKAAKDKDEWNQMNVKNERNKENVAWFDYKNTG